MLRIKLRRKGKKHEPHFRLVVMEGRSKLQGRFVDDLGWINPHEKKQQIEGEKVQEWIEKGAQPTDTVYNILIKEGILKGKKRPVHKKKKTKEGDEGEVKPEAKGEDATPDAPETPAEESKEEEPKEEAPAKAEESAEKPKAPTSPDSAVAEEDAKASVPNSAKAEEGTKQSEKKEDKPSE